jgi:hypothetical protein
MNHVDNTQRSSVTSEEGLGDTQSSPNKQPWSVTRPNVLVVACSDGRLQESLDDFLNNRLGIRDYDRLFVPGGAGALAPGGHEYARAEHFRKEVLFLVHAHGTTELILIAHGAAADGPPKATCAHYRRLMPDASLQAVRQQQVDDIRDFLFTSHHDLAGIQVIAYRAEVTADHAVAYVPVG